MPTSDDAAFNDPAPGMAAILNRSTHNMFPGAKKTPGDQPLRQDMLATYRPYTTLAEHETLTRGLASEMSPVKRQTIADYGSPGAARDVEPSFTPRPGPLAAPGSAREEDIASRSSGSASRTGSDRGSAAVSSQGRSSARERAGAAGALAALAEEMPKEQPRELPREPHMEAAKDLALPEPPAHAAAAALGSRSPPTPRHAAKANPASSLSTAKVAGAVCVGLSPSALSTPRGDPKVQMVPAAVSCRPEAQKPDRPQVRDKEREKYPTSKYMRPALEANRHSKKRLEELLGKPDARLNASLRHASHSFTTVPSTNVRVS